MELEVGRDKSFDGRILYSLRRLASLVLNFYSCQQFTKFNSDFPLSFTPSHSDVPTTVRFITLMTIS